MQADSKQMHFRVKYSKVLFNSQVGPGETIMPLLYWVLRTESSLQIFTLMKQPGNLSANHQPIYGQEATELSDKQINVIHFSPANVLHATSDGSHTLPLNFFPYLSTDTRMKSSGSPDQWNSIKFQLSPLLFTFKPALCISFLCCSYFSLHSKENRQREVSNNID